MRQSWIFWLTFHLQRLNLMALCWLSPIGLPAFEHIPGPEHHLGRIKRIITSSLISSVINWSTEQLFSLPTNLVTLTQPKQYHPVSTWVVGATLYCKQPSHFGLLPWTCSSSQNHLRYCGSRDPALNSFSVLEFVPVSVQQRSLNLLPFLVYGNSMPIPDNNITLIFRIPPGCCYAYHVIVHKIKIYMKGLK